jgi:hypothetical protein
MHTTTTTTTTTTRPSISSRDREIMSMVTFFLRETTDRCRALAAAAEAETMRAELGALVRTLDETLTRLGG